MREGLALVQQSLLEADVSFDVARDFVSRISEEAMGEKVLINIKSFTDGNPPPDRVLLGVTA